MQFRGHQTLDDATIMRECMEAAGHTDEKEFISAMLQGLTEYLKDESEAFEKKMKRGC